MQSIARQYLLGLGLMAARLATPTLARGQDAPAAAPATPVPAQPTPPKPTPPKPAPVKTTTKKPQIAPKVAAHPAKPTAPQVKKVAATPRKPPPAKKLAATPKPTPPKTAAAAPKPAEPKPSYTITTTRNNVTYMTRVVPVPGGAPPAPQQVATAPANPPPAEPPAPKPAASPAAANPAPAQSVSPPAGTAPPAQAAPQPPAATPASAFVTRFLTDAFNIARENGVSSLQRRAQLADLFAARMDIPRIAGYTAGDELASAPSEVQRRFQAILISYL